MYRIVRYSFFYNYGRKVIICLKTTDAEAYSLRRYDKKRRLKYRRRFLSRVCVDVCRKTYIRTVSIRIVWVRYTIFANSIIERVRVCARLKTFSEIDISCKSFYGGLCMNFSEKLKTLRKQKNLSQEELAEKIHVKPSGNYKVGKRNGASRHRKYHCYFPFV